MKSKLIIYGACAAFLAWVGFEFCKDICKEVAHHSSSVFKDVVQKGANK